MKFDLKQCANFYLLILYKLCSIMDLRIKKMIFPLDIIFN